MATSYTKKTCDDCKGTGWIEGVLWMCDNCKSTEKCCHICESVKIKGKYTECKRCWGGGVIYISKTTNKETLAPYLKKIV